MDAAVPEYVDKNKDSKGTEKSKQGNIGWATAAFMLDIYGSIIEKMKPESVAWMEQFLKAVIL